MLGDEPLKKTNKKNSRPTGRIIKSSRRPLLIAKLVPKLIDCYVSQEHRSVVSSFRVPCVRFFIQEAIIHCANEGNGHVLKVIAEQTQLPSDNFDLAMTEISQHSKMLGPHFRRRLIADLEGARRIKYITIK